MLFYKNRFWGVYLISVDAGIYFAAKMGKQDQIKILTLPAPDHSYTGRVAFSPKIDPKLAEVLIKTSAQIENRFDFKKSLNDYIKGVATETKKAAPSPSPK